MPALRLAGKQSTDTPVEWLGEGATVAVVGGGPGGAFSAIHLLNRARQHGIAIRVVIFESRCHPTGKVQDGLAGPYVGCPQCAGGISPGLHEALESLGISLAPEVVQARISSITVQGNWKSIYLPIPQSRTMSSVFRGTLPFGQHLPADCFDAALLRFAIAAGAELIGSRVFRAAYLENGGVELSYMANSVECQLKADFAIFAGGVNDSRERGTDAPTTMQLFHHLQPNYVPPQLRKALIFELEAREPGSMAREGELHFVECSSNTLRLDMCSILSKRGYITVSLVGESVDESDSHQQNLNVIKDFLSQPQIRRVLPIQMRPCVRCICNPSLVVGTAKWPFADRIAAVGDMVTARQYKDGILSAHNMAASVADTIFSRGVSSSGLAEGYGRMIAGIQKDNRYAVVIFVLYRRFFTNPVLSRIIYQAFTSEKKTRTESQRTFRNIFWAISSGDESYRDIAREMLRPGILWLIFRGGVLVTMRSWLTERFFGIRWRGIARVTTAVSRDDLGARRSPLLLARSWSGPHTRPPEFECIYSIRIRSGPDPVRALLAQFGEKSRPYLRPRWVNIQRASGEPLQEGCVINYRVFGGLISFSIEQQPTTREALIAYRVRGGFADGGLFCFQMEPWPGDYTLLTVYLAFDYARGTTAASRVFWGLFRRLFPEFIHDVLWNHALCELKQVAEARNAVAWELHI